MFPEELKIKFKNIVNARSGLYFKDYDLRDLEQGILKRMQACKVESPLSYYNILTVSEQRDNEFRELLNILTVNHTYFFRNEPQFNVLKEKIIPEIISRRLPGEEKPSLRIWSAGCSTGEEPYSLAILIKETIPDLENWDIQILATDVSARALEAARKGEYGLNSMRPVSQEYRDKYFDEKDSLGRDTRYAIHDTIKKMVNFDFFNLMDENYPGNFDIIFCRNVTIYFELETTIRVMDRIYRSLNDDGFLFIGYSESLQFISDNFKMLDYHDAIYYCKSKAVPKPEAKPFIPQLFETDKVLEEISRKEIEAEIEKLKPLVSAKEARTFSDLLTEAKKYLHAKKYYAALELIEEARRLDVESPEPYYLEAEALSNLNRIEEAKEKLNTALKRNSLFAPAYYLLGSFASEDGKQEEAKRNFKKALYLDRDFILARFSLAGVFKNEGKLDEAIREYRNILNLLAKNTPDDIIAFSGGFSAVALSGACRSNIERLKIGA